MKKSTVLSYLLIFCILTAAICISEDPIKFDDVQDKNGDRKNVSMPIENPENEVKVLPEDADFDKGEKNLEGVDLKNNGLGRPVIQPPKEDVPLVSDESNLLYHQKDSPKGFIAGRVPMPGAPVSKVITSKNLTMAIEAMSSVQKGFDATNKQLLYFSSQVVAGVNYRMVWRLKVDGKSEYQCVTVWKKLYSQGNGYEQTSKNKAVDEKSKACQECNASATCADSPNNSKVLDSSVIQPPKEDVPFPGPPVSKAITSKNVTMAIEMMSSVQKDFTATNKQLLYFSSQQVADVYYRMVWRLKVDGKSEYQCVIVWKKLYLKVNGYEQLSENKAIDDKSKACQQCDASATCADAPNNSEIEGKPSKDLNHFGSISDWFSKPKEDIINAGKNYWNKCMKSKLSMIMCAWNFNSMKGKLSSNFWKEKIMNN